MTKKVLWIFMALLSVVIGLYPTIYFLTDRNFGLLSSKSNEVLTSIYWNIGFYVHIVFGGLALLIGWVQFNSKIRNKNLKLHRQIGKIYIVSVFFSSLAGFYISLFATGGLMTSLGFACLAVIWFYTTLMAYLNIRNKRIEQHQKMMTYSYAACFAAVTLRIWLPVLTALLGFCNCLYYCSLVVLGTEFNCCQPNCTTDYTPQNRNIGKSFHLSKVYRRFY